MGGETVLFGFKLGQPVGQGAVPTAMTITTSAMGFLGFGKLGAGGFQVVKTEAAKRGATALAFTA